MSVMAKMDEDLDALKADGETLTGIWMNTETRRQLRDEIMATMPTVETDPKAFGGQVERYRDLPIVVLDELEDGAIVYGLAV